MIFEQNLNEIDTVESYFGKIIFDSNNLVIPYINLGISKHELNGDESLKFINYCYVVGINLSFLKINSGIAINRLNNDYNSSNSIHLGGNDLYLSNHQTIFDIEFQAQRSFLQLIDNSQIRTEYWVPESTPNFRLNMNTEIVKAFIQNGYLPSNIRKLISSR